MPVWIMPLRLCLANRAETTRRMPASELQFIILELTGKEKVASHEFPAKPVEKDKGEPQ